MKTLICCLLLAATTLSAEDRGIRPAPLLRPQFVMVLKPGTEPEPELEKYDATKEAQSFNRILIRVSEDRARELSTHPRVHYLQRILKPGELSGYVPLRAPQERVGGLVPDAVTNPAWDSGDYQYDGAGNIIGVGGDYYSYDQLGRIGRASLTGTAAYDQYIYDSFGNLVERGTSLGGGWSVQPILANGWDNRLNNATYDGVGNMKTGGGNPYGYNYDPFKMALEQYGPGRQDYIVYDASDERIGIRSADQAWKWTIRDLDGSVVRQWETPSWSFGTWMWVEDFVKGVGPIAGSEREAAEGGRRHFHADHLGTTRMVTNHSGQAISRHDFSPYGVEITSIRQELDRGYSWPTSMVFTGHERDFLGGLWTQNSDYIDYMHARYYRASLGRFSTVDPRGGSIRVPQSLNRYSYAAGNPTNFVDPTGQEPCMVSYPGVNGGKEFQSDCMTVNGKVPRVSTVSGAAGSLIDLAFFLIGRLPAHSAARPASVEELRTTPAMDNIREQYKASDCTSEMNYSDFQKAEVLATPSVTGQLVGGFAAKIRPVGNGMVVVHAWNTWGRESGTRLPGTTNRNNASIQDVVTNPRYFAMNAAFGGGLPTEPRSVLNDVDSGMAANATLHYIWTEGSPCEQ